MAIPFIAVEISGLVDQTYASSATSKKYVDETFYPSSLGVGVSSAVLANTLHSANSALHSFNVVNYMTSTNALANFYPSALGKGVSSNVKLLDDWYEASGDAYSKAYASAQLATYDGLGPITWVAPSVASGMVLAGTGKISGSATFYIDDYIASTSAIQNFYGSSLGKGVSGNVKILDDWYEASAQALSAYQASGDEYSAAYSWYNASASRISEFVASGDEYSAAYASAQALKEHALHAKISSSYLAVAYGWANVPSESPISHGLSSKPNSVAITPSGLVTFATVFGHVNATQFWVSTSAADDRTINWRAEV